MLPACLLGASFDSWAAGCLLVSLVPPSSWMGPGWRQLASTRDSDFLDFLCSQKGWQTNCKRLSKMVSNLHLKCWKIRLGTVFFIFQIYLISEGFVFSFLMLSGRVESMKIARKPCRVSQNRGSAVSLLIRIFVQKTLKIASPMASKIIDNPKTPRPGSLRKRSQFVVRISNTFQ